jgi:hypothetical protein
VVRNCATGLEIPGSFITALIVGSPCHDRVRSSATSCAGGAQSQQL